MKARHSEWVNSSMGPHASLEVRTKTASLVGRHSTQSPFWLKLLFRHIDGFLCSFMLPPGSMNVTQHRTVRGRPLPTQRLPEGHVALTPQFGRQTLPWSLGVCKTDAKQGCHVALREGRGTRAAELDGLLTRRVLPVSELKEAARNGASYVLAVFVPEVPGYPLVSAWDPRWVDNRRRLSSEPGAHLSSFYEACKDH